MNRLNKYEDKFVSWISSYKLIPSLKDNKILKDDSGGEIDPSLYTTQVYKDLARRYNYNENNNNSSNPDNQSLNSTNSNFKSKSFQMLPNGFIVCKLNLLKRLHVDENGWTILRILGQRGSKDAMAREFMNLKSATRNDPVSN